MTVVAEVGMDCGDNATGGVIVMGVSLNWIAGIQGLGPVVV